MLNCKRLTFLLFGGLMMLLLVACQPQESTVSILAPEAESVLGGEYPTLADMWDGKAHFVLEVPNTGLPMGESETIVVEPGHFWSYVHASDRSAGTIDRCGEPVEFPGCTVIYRSEKGFEFHHDDPPICQFECQSCPCESERDHIDQQQYPDVFYDGDTMYMVYEYRGGTKMRTSPDGLVWGDPHDVGQAGHWYEWWRDCESYEYIGSHPFVPHDYDCLAGAPPGLYVEDGVVYVFMAMGQAPANMGCYRGSVDDAPEDYVRCNANPLFTGALEYGPLEAEGVDGHPYWDFRTISSAEIHPIGTGEDRRYYMFYEGIRGPSPSYMGGDSQFGIGLARSTTNQLDGPWEKFENNPVLLNLPGNIGQGHVDLVVFNGETIMYTSLDGVVRSRLKLIWK